MFRRDYFVAMWYNAFVQSANEQRMQFPLTRWSLVVQAARTVSPESQQALEELCRAYWPPLLAYLRRVGSSPDEARNLLQDFISRLLERNDLQAVAPARGRFRSYLLAGLRNSLASDFRRKLALKRGGGMVISIETERLDGPEFIDREGLSPDEAYDITWAQTILRRAINSLHKEYAGRGRGELFDVLKPALGGTGEEAHATWGRTLGMTPGAVAVAVHRLRVRLRQLVRVEVAQTLQDPAEIDDEMRNLKAILSRAK